MITRVLLFSTAFAVWVPSHAQESAVSIVRDLLVPPSLFEDKTTGKRIDPRKRFAAEGITFGKEESVAYDPGTSRLFVRAVAPTILRLEKLLQAEMSKGFALVTLTYGVLKTREPLLSDEAAEKPSLVSTRILTTGEQVEALVVRAGAARLGTVLPGSSVTAKSGESTEARIGDALTRNVPVISADASTVEMTLTLLQGPAGADPQIVGETRVAIPSGGSVALEEWLGENSWRTRLITAVIVDAAGVPLPPRNTTELPDTKEPHDPGQSLFPGPVPEPAIEKVKTIIIPSLVFEQTPLLEVIEILKKASVEYDTSQPESQRGVNLRFFYPSRPGLDQTPITLRLGNVPLAAAIHYTAEVADCDYRIEGGTVLFGIFAVTAPGGAEDIWYAAFLRQEEAEDFERAGKVPEATSKRLQALTFYEALAAKYPGYQPKAVEERMGLLKGKVKFE